ncbi:Centromere protein J [Amphibalanus amphitrite]|uniref:Centromere protein J n=1 Tax=Amphibalanus amphitrite TaxID=1232801 RepID=A0A6A4WMC0_AMPAM|nr:Centromere protein J [Amphibalanus amphitrite]
MCLNVEILRVIVFDSTRPAARLVRPSPVLHPTPPPALTALCRRQRELKELRAFELLEQAALDSSFSSNSSFVSNLLHAAQSTPERRGRPGAPAALSPLAAPPAASERPGAGAPVGGDRPGAAPTAQPERAAAARGGGAPAAGPAGQSRGCGGQPRAGTVVRPNVAAAGVTPPPGRPDWSAAPCGRPPDSEASLDASLAVSPARAAAPADPEPEEEPEEEQGDRLERYRRLRDQLRRELDGRCERAAGPAGWADPLRRSVRFDDQPDVFEITADGSCDVTLTSEAGDGAAGPERRPAPDRTAGGEQLERGVSPERPAGGCGPPEDRAQSRSRSGAGAASAPAALQDSGPARPAALQDSGPARPAGRTESTRRPAGAEPFLFDRAGLERQRAALDREAATFREENALLSRLRADLQRQRLDLDSEKERWERQKAEDAERMARRTEQERKKLADERKQFEAEKKRHTEEWRKRETPELKALHAKVTALEAELGRRGSSWSQDAARLRARLAHLTADRDRLERLLQSAHQQLARRNARQFSAGAGPHRSGSVEGDEPAAGRRRTTLSRHRSAPDLADGGGSTSSVSTAGGRSSRGSGPDRGGRKATGAGGRRWVWRRQGRAAGGGCGADRSGRQEVGVAPTGAGGRRWVWRRPGRQEVGVAPTGATGGGCGADKGGRRWV